MIDTATPEQALIAWHLRSEQRTWWIELMDTRKIKITMQERETGSSPKNARVYLDIELTAGGDVANTHDVAELIKRGLEEWQKKYRILS